MHRRLSSALLMALAGQQAAAALPDGLAGPWYNPQQSGHGLSISLVEHGRRAVVLWHTYDRSGAPLTLYVDADTRGRELQGTAFAPRGMRFGDFDPATLDLPIWGAVRIRFDDCDHATLHWEANDPAFGRGATPITRLARIEGLDCSLPPPNPIAPGLRRASYPEAGSSGPAAFGMVDSEGRLLALTGSLSDTGSITATLPGPGYLSSFTPLLFITEPLGTLADGSTAVAQRTITPFGAVSTHGVALFDVPRSTRSEGRWTAGADGVGRFRYGVDERLPLAGEQVWEVVPESLARQLLRPLDLADLAGSYRFPLRSQLFTRDYTLRIADDGSTCIGITTDCSDLLGHVTTVDGADGLFAFRLGRPGDLPSDAFVGRGWVMRGGQPGSPQIVLVGENGATGLALVGTRSADATR